MEDEKKLQKRQREWMFGKKKRKKRMKIKRTANHASTIPLECMRKTNGEMFYLSFFLSHLLMIFNRNNC